MNGLPYSNKEMPDIIKGVEEGRPECIIRLERQYKALGVDIPKNLLSAIEEGRRAVKRNSFNEKQDKLVAAHTDMMIVNEVNGNNRNLKHFTARKKNRNVYFNDIVMEYEKMSGVTADTYCAGFCQGNTQKEKENSLKNEIAKKIRESIKCNDVFIGYTVEDRVNEVLFSKGNKLLGYFRMADFNTKTTGIYFLDHNLFGNLSSLSNVDEGVDSIPVDSKCSFLSPKSPFVDVVEDEYFVSANEIGHADPELYNIEKCTLMDEWIERIEKVGETDIPIQTNLFDVCKLIYQEMGNIPEESKNHYQTKIAEAFNKRFNPNNDHKLSEDIFKKFRAIKKD